MMTLNATDARSKLSSLIDEAVDTHRPVVITGTRGNAVLVAEEDWNVITETLHLLSVPGMHESIRAGMNQPVSECDQALDGFDLAELFAFVDNQPMHRGPHAGEFIGDLRAAERF